MTPLAELLIRRIAATGPLTIADYMNECLLHPEHGYYTTQDPFGLAGDFTTAPEISQMFGEMLGLALAQAWVDQGSPQAFALAELGPGRGTLMADILRTIHTVPGMGEAAKLHLVEASPVLRARQRDALGQRDATWLGTAQELPHMPLFLVANEFFDALPIRQFTRGAVGWHEHLVTAQDQQLSMVLGPDTPYGDLMHRLSDTQPGEIVETCAPARPIIAEIAQRIGQHGGAAILLDYGDWCSRGDTFQALKAHEMVAPLAEPGQADLTAHVDFEALSMAAKGVQVSAMTNQGVFLERLGITARAQALAKRLEGDRLDAHIAAHRRLTHPQEMGSLFKALGLTPDGAARLPGLDP
ncbi:hypothetical protein AIOL_000143 [Candidatus Rhodobacter oscarellae]|uniref:SAM-dependent methyltransferase, MidA n=1 Tax=Candidatus Rhodobacter oscarellae TaxID=1675527 RepID=A0A0J9H2T3_9RHOB|nr:SAM-dependent methyltransferase [Candidatus Rhodobacter lobularis]KMW59993.1 hypothetical protein AIOL_000143 [Candidatus Rhodobacter lobularis]